MDVFSICIQRVYFLKTMSKQNIFYTITLINKGDEYFDDNNLLGLFVNIV